MPAMEPRSRDGSREGKTITADGSRRQSTEGSSKASKAQSPKSLTSFPSLSPPETPRSKKKVPSSSSSSSPWNIITGAKDSEDNSTDASDSSAQKSSMAKSKPRAISTPIVARKGTAATQANVVGTSAMNRTVQAAANLRRSILDSIILRQPAKSSTSPRIFANFDEAASDPLSGASDDHVQRIINSSGGAILTVRKYSADLAETNERVATERNSKLRLVEENRDLRAQIRQMEEEREGVELNVSNIKRLFERYVAQHQSNLAPSPQLEFLESPAGPYVLGTSEGSTSSMKELEISFQGDKSMDTIRPKKVRRPARLPQRLVSAVKTEAVEMKSPLDINAIPPALREQGAISEALVDPLGFYITPDREKRHQEAAIDKTGDTSESSSIDTNLRGDDDSAISANEMLCDAPTTPATKLIFRSESSMRVFIEVDRTAQPTEGVTTTTATPTTTTHSGFDIAATSALGTLVSGSNSNQDSRALSSLLVKLNEAYDIQQRRRTKEWIAFYEQAREVVQKSRDASSDEDSIAGVVALCSASKVSLETRIAFNGLIRRGVPVSFRKEVWLERSGANNIRDPELYESLLKDGLQNGSALSEIDVDVERTLANNVFFREGEGKTRLRDVLLAFSQQNHNIGYSQGLNIIAANLLLIVPSAEDGYALLEVLVKDILPSDYYHRDGTVSGVVLERDGQVLDKYVQEFLPNLHKHLGDQGAPLTMFTPGWFISAFACLINGEALYRLWDLIFGFCDGRFIFCFALALLKLNRRRLLACRSSEELMSYLGGKMSSAAVSLDTLINETFKIGEKVTERDINRRRVALSNVS